MCHCPNIYGLPVRSNPRPFPGATLTTAFSVIAIHSIRNSWDLNSHMIGFTSIPPSIQFLGHILEGSFGVL